MRSTHLSGSSPRYRSNPRKSEQSRRLQTATTTVRVGSLCTNAVFSSPLCRDPIITRLFDQQTRGPSYFKVMCYDVLELPRFLDIVRSYTYTSPTSFRGSRGKTYSFRKFDCGLWLTIKKSPITSDRDGCTRGSLARGFRSVIGDSLSRQAEKRECKGRSHRLFRRCRIVLTFDIDRFSQPALCGAAYYRVGAAFNCKSAVLLESRRCVDSADL